jgi:tRNA (guanine37-N1)-methyltransferase
MRIHILTLFPEMFGSPLAAGILHRARQRGLLDVSLHQLRDYASGRHLQVDDTPYGGGQGMVLKPEPLVAAIEHIAAADRPRRILLTPQGAPFTQARAATLAAEPALLLVCGRYEGVDERVRPVVDEELTVGDYVLSGGEPAALVVLDAVARLVPGVLGNEASSQDESHSAGLLEYPQYTRPPEFRGQRIPDVLLSGDHAAIARWRREESLRRTFERRPELLATAPLDDADRAFLRRLGWSGG